MDGLASKCDGFNWRGNRIAALEKNLVKDVLICSPFPDVTDVEFELSLQRWSVMRDTGVPGLEVRFRQLENTKATIRFLTTLEIKLSSGLGVELLNDSANALFGDFGDGQVVFSLCWFSNLAKNEASLTSVLFIQFKYLLPPLTQTNIKFHDYHFFTRSN